MADSSIMNFYFKCDNQEDILNYKLLSSMKYTTTVPLLYGGLWPALKVWIQV